VIEIQSVATATDWTLIGKLNGPQALALCCVHRPSVRLTKVIEALSLRATTLKTMPGPARSGLWEEKSDG